MWEKTFSSRWLASALGLCLAVAGGPALGAEHTFDGTYSGQRVLTKGSCAAADDVSVIIQGETLTFTNSALKKSVMGFFVRQDGSFDQIDTDVDGDRVHIVGRITGQTIAGKPGTPHWRAVAGVAGRQPACCLLIA